jgi:hypothetical protein
MLPRFQFPAFGALIPKSLALQVDTVGPDALMTNRGARFPANAEACAPGTSRGGCQIESETKLFRLSFTQGEGLCFDLAVSRLESLNFKTRCRCKQIKFSGGEFLKGVVI